MSATMEETEITAPASGLRIAHRQHPKRDYPPYSAWCGAEVIGIVADVPLNCPDCLELVRQARERGREQQERDREWRKQHPGGPSRDWFGGR